MMDLSFSINGVPSLAPLHSLVPLHDVPSVDSNGDLKHTRLSMNVMKGQFAQKYTSIGVQLVSECEWEMSRDWLYRSPISSTAFLGDFKWERKCPKVQWDESTINKYLFFTASKENSNTMSMTLLNPDPLNLWTSDFVTGDTKGTNHLVHSDVAYVRIQWRTAGEGEWINAWELIGEEENIWKNDAKPADLKVCNTSRGIGCTLDWNLERQYLLNGLNDGKYEIRSKVFCSGYDSFATTDVKESVTDDILSLIVDMTAPVATETYHLNHTMRVAYTEPITCPQLSSQSMSYEVTRLEKCDGNPVPVGRISDEELQFHYKFICTGTTGNPGSLVIDFPRNTLPGKYEVLVNAGLNSGPKVVDGAGNKVKKEVFTTLVGCSEKEIGPPLFAKSAELGDTSSSTSTVDSGVLKMNVFLIAYAVACSVWCIFTTFKNARLKNAQATDHELHENIPILDEKVSDVAQKPAYGSVI